MNVNSCYLYKVLAPYLIVQGCVRRESRQFQRWERTWSGDLRHRPTTSDSRRQWVVLFEFTVVTLPVAGVLPSPT